VSQGVDHGCRLHLFTGILNPADGPVVLQLYEPPAGTYACRRCGQIEPLATRCSPMRGWQGSRGRRLRCPYADRSQSGGGKLSAILYGVCVNIPRQRDCGAVLGSPRPPGGGANYDRRYLTDSVVARSA
jgi:hypothetical protein